MGISHALLWGVFGGLLRFVPYAGVPIAAAFPVALALALFPGWHQAALARAIKEFRRTGCVTRLDAVPLRTSLKQEKRQKPVPHHRPASTGRKSSMIAFARASGAPFRLPRLGALQIWIPQ
jgi:hypothetical protein